MYSYSYKYPPSAPMSGLGFNPLNIRGLQLYFNSNDVTPASWLDRSSNAFDFVQATATKQPSKVVNVDGSTKAVFDGVDDFQRYGAAQPLNDNIGMFFFSGYFVNTARNWLFSSSSETTNLNVVTASISFTGAFIFQIHVNGVYITVVSDVLIANNTYYNISINNYGVNDYEVKINGVVVAYTISGTLPKGKWLSDSLNRDNIRIGSRTYKNGVVYYDYGPLEANKMIYSNVDLTPIEITDINNFMSNPLS